MIPSTSGDIVTITGYDGNARPTDVIALDTSYINYDLATKELLIYPDFSKNSFDLLLKIKLEEPTNFYS
jgi:hypothetical protein